MCADCGETKRDVYKPKMNRKPHRLCKVCTPESDFLIEFIAVNKLVFGKDSEIGLKWHKKVPEIPEENLSLSISKKGYRKFTVEIFNEVWDSYNYSLREFIGLMTYNMNQNEVYKMIEKVYEELFEKGVEEKLENIIFVIVMVLCFASPDVTV